MNCNVLHYLDLGLIQTCIALAGGRNGAETHTGAPIGVQQKLMRHSNVATTMNVYGKSTLRAKQVANSKVGFSGVEA